MRLKEGSRKVVFIQTGDCRIQMSLPLSVLQKKTKFTETIKENIWMTSITDRYKSRPTTRIFIEMCLASFTSQYRVLPKDMHRLNKCMVCMTFTDKKFREILPNSYNFFGLIIQTMN